MERFYCFFSNTGSDEPLRMCRDFHSYYKNWSLPFSLIDKLPYMYMYAGIVLSAELKITFWNEDFTATNLHQLLKSEIHVYLLFVSVYHIFMMFWNVSI